MKDPQSSQHTKLICQPFVPSAGGSESPWMEQALHLHHPLFRTLLVCKGQSSYLPELRCTKPGAGWRTTCFGRPGSASRENGGGTRRGSRGEASKPSCRFHQGSYFLPQQEPFWSQEYKELVKAEEERRKREEEQQASRKEQSNRSRMTFLQQSWKNEFVFLFWCPLSLSLPSSSESSIARRT